MNGSSSLLFYSPSSTDILSPDTSLRIRYHKMRGLVYHIHHYSQSLIEFILYPKDHEYRQFLNMREKRMSIIQMFRNSDFKAIEVQKLFCEALTNVKIVIACAGYTNAIKWHVWDILEYELERMDIESRNKH